MRYTVFRDKVSYFLLKKSTINLIIVVNQYLSKFRELNPAIITKSIKIAFLGKYLLKCQKWYKQVLQSAKAE